MPESRLAPTPSLRFSARRVVSRRSSPARAIGRRAPGCSKLGAWASADARGLELIHRKGLVPFVPYRSERLATVVLPDIVDSAQHCRLRGEISPWQPLLQDFMRWRINFFVQSYT